MIRDADDDLPDVRLTGEMLKGVRRALERKHAVDDRGWSELDSTRRSSAANIARDPTMMPCSRMLRMNSVGHLYLGVPRQRSDGGDGAAEADGLDGLFDGGLAADVDDVIDADAAGQRACAFTPRGIRRVVDGLGGAKARRRSSRSSRLEVAMTRRPAWTANWSSEDRHAARSLREERAIRPRNVLFEERMPRREAGTRQRGSLFITQRRRSRDNAGLRQNDGVGKHPGGRACTERRLSRLQRIPSVLPERSERRCHARADANAGHVAARSQRLRPPCPSTAPCPAGSCAGIVR